MSFMSELSGRLLGTLGKMYHLQSPGGDQELGR